MSLIVLVWKNMKSNLNVKPYFVLLLSKKIKIMTCLIQIKFPAWQSFQTTKMFD